MSSLMAQAVWNANLGSIVFDLGHLGFWAWIFQQQLKSLGWRSSKLSALPQIWRRRHDGLSDSAEWKHDTLSEAYVIRHFNAVTRGMGALTGPLNAELGSNTLLKRVMVRHTKQQSRLLNWILNWFWTGFEANSRRWQRRHGVHACAIQQCATFSMND